MAIFHQELGQVCTTMYLQGSAADNTVCKMHANDTVAACAAGNDFIGVVVGKRDGLACVQVAGFVTLHYTGTTAPTVGECALAGDGKGGVAVTENAKKYRVLRVDTAAKTVGLYLSLAKENRTWHLTTFISKTACNTRPAAASHRCSSSSTPPRATAARRWRTRTPSSASSSASASA